MSNWLGKLKIPPLGILVMLLALAMACGTAAPADQAPADTGAPASNGEPAATPVAQSDPVSPPSSTETAVDRIVYAMPGTLESNRFWMVSRPDQGQYGPHLETLADISPDGEFVPLLAESWEVSNNGQDWTFHLRQGAQFHHGWGELTTRDLLLSQQLHARDEAVASFSHFWASMEFDAIDDHRITFRADRPFMTMDYVATRASDLQVVSQAQFDVDGIDGIDNGPAGTGKFQYVDRRSGEYLLWERAEEHWSGVLPEYRELYWPIVPEPATRFALMMTEEAHIAPLPPDLANDAISRGMKVIESGVASDWLAIYFPNQYHNQGDPVFDPTSPYADIRVRQALNMAIDREEFRREMFHGKGEFIPVSGFTPWIGGYNPEWDEQFDELYGYNPDEAIRLLNEAGFPPDDLQIRLYTYPGVTTGGVELAEVVQAVAIYWEGIGIRTSIEDSEWGRVRDEFRNKRIAHPFPNSIGFRPIEQRESTYYSGGASHYYNDDVVDELYERLFLEADFEERARIEAAIGDRLFEQFSTIPLLQLAPEVVVNPIIEEWRFPGLAAGRFTHFENIKLAR